MNAEIAIALRGVSKAYPVFDSPWQRMLSLLGLGRPARSFVALQPLDLDIPRGVSLGIVGDNGAGKSTLMHLLAGSHQPSSGELRIDGQVLGLLELGVGFHPEFSGRDNIFFYGDMLQLERAYVQARYQEIVAFSELGSFIEQPLKTYSSGMKVRLAFALIATLDPDILIVDEALAVGDLHFQKKCIDRMTEFRRAGKTIIFCSHSIYQVGMFCDQVLWMKQGRVEMSGTPEEVLPAYEAYQMAKDARPDGSMPQAGTRARVERFEVESPLPLNTGDTLAIAWQVEAPPVQAYHVSVSLKMDSGRGVFVTGSHLRGDPPLMGSSAGRLVFPQIPLMGGEYTLHLRVWDDAGLIIYDERLIDSLVVRKVGKELGVVRLEHDWRIGPEVRA